MTSNAEKFEKQDDNTLLDSYQELQAKNLLLESRNNQLKQQLALRERTEQQRWQQMKRMQEMAIDISSSLQLDLVLDTIAKQTVELLNIDTCTIMLFEAPDQLVWIASVGRPEEIQRFGRQKVDQGLSGWVASNRKTLQVENVVDHELLLNPKLAKKYGYCTYLGVPMMIREKLIGVIELFSKRPERFADEDVRLLESVTAQASIAVEKAQLFQELTQRVDEIEWQNRAAHALSNELDATQILYTLSSYLAEALQATSVYISELRQKQILVLVSEYWAETAVKEERVSELGDIYEAADFPHSFATLREGKARIISRESAALSSSEEQTFSRYNVQTILFIPIIRAGITYGLAEIWDSSRLRKFTKREKRLATSIIQHAAGVIENARLFAQVKDQALNLEQEVEIRTNELVSSNHKLRQEIQERLRVEEELKNKTNSLLVLNRIADTIYQVFDIDVVYQRAVEALIEYPKFDGALIFLLNKQADLLEAVAWAGLKAGSLLSEARVPLHQSIIGQSVLQAKIVQARDLQKSTGIIESKKEQLLSDGFKGLVAVPILYKGEAIGVVNILLKRKNGISQLEEEMLFAISKTIGLAILNAEYVSQIEMEIEERQQVEEALQIYMSELKRSNLELQEFAYIASHDLQEPLRKIQAFGDRLSHRYAEQLDVRGVDYLNRMQQAAGRLRVLIDNLLLFSQVTTAAQPFSKVDLNEVITNVLSDLSVRINETNTIVEVDSLPTIEAEPTQMHQLLQNLIGNALKFTKPDTQPKIEIKCCAIEGRNLSSGMLNQQPMVQLAVSDNGIGIEKKYQKRVFQLFERLHSRRAYEGTGIGLAICRKIVDRHNGLIYVQSEINKGTTFFIELPVSQTNL